MNSLMVYVRPSETDKSVKAERDELLSVLRDLADNACLCAENECDECLRARVVLAKMENSK